LGAVKDLIEDLVPGAICGAPATEEQLTSIEARLGFALPPSLRAFYVQANGFREPLGNAAYLLPLDEMASSTEYFWCDWLNDSPQGPDFTGFIVFGSSGADEHWAMKITAPHEVIGYHHHMEGTPERLGNDLVAVFRNDYAIMREYADGQPVEASEDKQSPAPDQVRGDN
jgi:SMI1 / KNR4 family (SUKH-1)